jgi:phosphomannomutase
MSNKTIVLFDMDGTLTPARLPADDRVGNILAKLSNYSKIGIVTGSGLDYLIQQCKSIWSGIDGISPADITLLPCNGTKLYSWDGNKWYLQHSVDMRDKIGDSHFDLLMKILIGAQFTHISTEPEHALTGHFISYRGSMVNWCPVGRNANKEQRNNFIQYDQKTDMRFRLMTGVQAMLDKIMGERKVQLAMGGNTSIDIYPTGWDKTYALGHFPDHECWFVGDRCGPTGNDRQIYELLAKEGRGFETTSPEETIKIIEEIIRRLNPTQ